MDTEPSPASVYPKTVNHMAVSAPNLEEAVKWYKEVFGFKSKVGNCKINRLVVLT